MTKFNRTVKNGEDNASRIGCVIKAILVYSIHGGVYNLKYKSLFL